MRFSLTGVVPALAYWVIDSAINSFALHQGNFFNQLFHPAGKEVWDRFLVITFILMLGAIYTNIGTVNLRQEIKRLRQNEEKLHQVLDHIREVFWMTDPGKNEMIYISPGYEEIWGRTCESLYQSPRAWMEAIHPDDRERVKKAAESKQSCGEYNEEYRIIRPDGTIRWIHDRAYPIFNHDGQVYRVTGIAEDITARKEAEIAFRESEARFSGIVSVAVDAIIMVDEALNIIFFNKGAELIFGYQTSEVMGQSLDLLIPGRFVEAHRKHIQAFGTESATVTRHMTDRDYDIFGRRKDGTEFLAEVSITKWIWKDQKVFTAVLRDIGERKRSEETIQRLAYYDTLTGLPNRHLFHDLLEKAISQGERDGRSVAVLLLDLDRFREINDTLGHHRGDILLQKVGIRLKEALFTTDTVARLGGDEFGILLSMASSNDSGSVANKILKALEEPFEIEGLPVVVETGIGVAFYPDHGSSADSLIQRGDVAMYASKTGKIDFVIYNSELDYHSPRRLALMGELRQAIENRQLFLNYQPVIDLQTRRVCGVEALVRWNHPKYGIIPPDQFILPAEQTGLIKPLTKFVLHEAIQQRQAWVRGGKTINMAINLSVRNLQDPLLPSQMMQMIHSLGIEPTWLNFEITESAIMMNVESVAKTISFLNHEGINFSIDDFGIGYTSLSYLKKLAVKSIKIDRSFIKNMLFKQEDYLIVRSTIDLAHSLNLRVIAEGVEDQETLEKLTALGCDEAQGFFICRPIPAEDFLRWTNESSWDRELSP